MKIVNVKEVLGEGLIRLSKNKDISKITVQEIIDECHTSRRTFYNHFHDKYELMNWIYESKTQAILDCFQISKNWMKCVQDMYAVFDRDKEFYMNISSFEGQNSFHDFVFNYTRDFFIKYIKNNYNIENLTDELFYVIDYHCCGLVYSGIIWLKGGQKIPAAKVAKWQYECMPMLIYN